jgi:L-lactate dehydrogenase
VATDLQYGASLSSVVDIRDGDYSDLAGAALVLISAGVNEQTGGATDRHDTAGRLRLLDTNADVYREILPPLSQAAPEAVILVLTDPPDPLADLVRMFGFKYVLSSGTFLVSLRFRFHLAPQLGVDPASVEANVLGEHGTSEVFVWSSARVSGVPVIDARPCRAGSFNSRSSTKSATPTSRSSKALARVSMESAWCPRALRRWCCAMSAR